MPKRSLQEVCIPNGLKNEEVKCKKLKQPYSSPELFKLHSLMAFIGMRGSGKTHVSYYYKISSNKSSKTQYRRW
jgi:hypothetical protein